MLGPESMLGNTNTTLFKITCDGGHCTVFHSFPCAHAFMGWSTMMLWFGRCQSVAAAWWAGGCQSTLDEVTVIQSNRGEELFRKMGWCWP